MSKDGSTLMPSLAGQRQQALLLEAWFTASPEAKTAPDTQPEADGEENRPHFPPAPPCRLHFPPGLPSAMHRGAAETAAPVSLRKVQSGARER